MTYQNPSQLNRNTLGANAGVMVALRAIVWFSRISGFRRFCRIVLWDLLRQELPRVVTAADITLAMHKAEQNHIVSLMD